LTVLFALFACGPALRARDTVVLDPAPYRALMLLPGFDQLRAPARFWMMGELCLATAAGIGYAALAGGRRVTRSVLFALLAAGLLADGWVTRMPIAPAPPMWTAIPGSNPSLPLLELPLGPSWDAAATLRATAHRHPVMNGVSGYDPPHYAPLQVGLGAEDPDMLEAIASLGPYEVSVESANDPDGRWKRYAAAAPGAARIDDDGTRTIFRVPAGRWPEPAVGPALPIMSVLASRGDASPVFDRRTDTDWVEGTRQGDQWLLADLGRTQTIGGVSLAIEEHAGDFPRHLVIAASDDGERFITLWEGNLAAETFLAALRAPTAGWLRVAVPPVEGRFVRLSQTAPGAGWRVPELEINAPAGATRAPR
jgi:hypothetical protein